MNALKTLVFTIVVPGTVAGLIPWLLVQGSAGEVLASPTAWLAGVLVVVGTGLYLWCAGAFAFIGKGTPAPIDAPKVLVIRGPYRWVRNPMYVAVLTVILGQALLFHSWLLVGYALLVWAIVYVFVVLVEEPSLLDQFGASYEAYLRRVSRWIPHPPQE